MPKRFVWETDRYPFFITDTAEDGMMADDLVDLSEEEWADYDRVTAEFEDWQAKLRALVVIRR